MSNTNHTYKVIQLTNKALGAQAVNTYLPLGTITRKINCKNYQSVPFSVGNSNNNIVAINEPGYYKVTYNASLVAAAAGIVTINLVNNGDVIYSVSAIATEGGTVPLSLTYEIRLCPNSECNPYNLPVNVQMQLVTTAITDGTSNIIIEKVY